MPKAPRRLRPYPSVKPKTGVRWRGRGAVKWPTIRRERPRRHARAWRYRTRQDALAALESRASQEVRGSLPERIFYKALTDRGFIPGVDFSFQPSMFGGRTQLGGLVADFMFSVPRVIVQVQSVWHTVTAAHERRDEDQRVILESLGWTVLEIWPPTIESQAALDHWLNDNIMTLWGTSTQGIGVGSSTDVPFVGSVELDILLRIENTLDAILREVIGWQLTVT